MLLIVLLIDKLNCRNLLYCSTPFLLIADLILGKYSLLIFHYEVPYIWIRNFLFVGIPYFCIGNLIREKHCFGALSKKALSSLLAVFSATCLIERFVLVKFGLNATRDHYISTTFLAVCVFLYALQSNWKNDALAVIGRKYSTWLYVIHPLFITALAIMFGKFGIKLIYNYMAPILVYCTTLIFLIIMHKIKIKGHITLKQ